MTKQEYDKFVEQMDNIMDMMRRGAEKQGLTFACVFSIRKKGEEDGRTGHRIQDANMLDMYLLQKEVDKLAIIK